MYERVTQSRVSMKKITRAQLCFYLLYHDIVLAVLQEFSLIVQGFVLFTSQAKPGPATRQFSLQGTAVKVKLAIEPC
jgi:hypothetical protein